MLNNDSAGWEFWLQTDEGRDSLFECLNNCTLMLRPRNLALVNTLLHQVLKNHSQKFHMDGPSPSLISQLRTRTEKWKKTQTTPSLIFLMTKCKARNSKWSYLYLSKETRDKKSFIICATLVLFINTKTMVSANKIATKCKVLNSSVYQQHLLSFQSIFIRLIFYKFLPLFLR